MVLSTCLLLSLGSKCHWDRRRSSFCSGFLLVWNSGIVGFGVDDASAGESVM